MEKSSREKRLEELNALKEEFLILASHMESQSSDATFKENQGNEESNINKSNQSKGISKTLSTAVGRRMTNKENGFLNAFLIGFISLFFEIAFLLLALFLYQ